MIELLVVIYIIALLAAMIFPAIKTVNKVKLRTRARGEMAQIQSYIDGYKAKLGHYPPDNPGNPAVNQLYYELAGTTNNGPGSVFGTLDHNAVISPADLTATFGANVAGFINSTKAGAGDESRAAQKFLHDLKPDQLGSYLKITNLVCTVKWPDPNTGPLPGTGGLNPWRYNSSSPTNNTASFDLWVDIFIDGKTNRICNWSTQPLIVY